MKLAIRADGGPEIGSGHVIRCLALAEAWEGPVTFASRKLSPSLRGRIHRAGHLVYLLNDEDGLANVPMDRLVLDGYHLPTVHQSLPVPTLVIDDGGRVGHYRCSLVADANPDAPTEFYARQGARVLAGPRFAPISEKYLKHRASVCGRRQGHLVISLGSNAPAEVLVAATTAASRISEDVHVVLGGDQDLAGFACESVERAVVHHDLPDLAGLLAGARLAVLSGGSTNWEACVVGTPRIALTLADNQNEIAMALSRRGCAISVGEPPYDDGQLDKALQVWFDGRALDGLACNAWRICDGQGARRVARMLEIS